MDEQLLQAVQAWESSKEEFLTPLISTSHAGSWCHCSCRCRRQLQPSVKRHSITQALGKQGVAYGSWQSRRDQDTNATATTSLLFLKG